MGNSLNAKELGKGILEKSENGEKPVNTGGQETMEAYKQEFIEFVGWCFSVKLLKVLKVA